MCGIAGGIWIDPRNSLTPEQLRRMTNAMEHRGPDDEGLYFQDWCHDGTGKILPGVALGFRRLAIIDLDSGKQPMSNEDDSIQLVFNGEIYNYRELRRRLEGSGHQFRTESDTETIVHLYEDLGMECFEHLNGMFSIAIWDSRQQQLVLARDRLGKKPLYYAHHNGLLVFASELKSLMQVEGLPRKISPGSIDLFLTYQYVPHPHSIYEGINKVPPGHTVVYKNDRLVSQEYWKIDWQHERTTSVDDAVDKLRELLTDSVRFRLRSDVPLGAFLSGGIDSSLIAAIAQKQLGHPLKTFSIGFSEKDYDETEFAQLVATRIGSEHQRFEVTPDALQIMDSLAYHFDEPFGDSSAIPTWYLSECTRKQVTVALSGDGGDELFAGYDRYRALMFSQGMQQWLPMGSLNLKWMNRLPGAGKRRSLWRRIQRYCEVMGQPNDKRYMNWIQIFGEAARTELYRDDFIEQLPDRDPIYFLRQAWRRASDRDLLSQATLGDLQTYLPCDLMTKVDIASMAHSLEVRQPFLDYRLVEWAASLPSNLKWKWNCSKWLLHRAFQGWIPDAIWKRSKMGFGVPIARWMRGPMRSHVESMLLGPETRSTQYFRREALQDLVSRHVQGSSDEGYRLWNLLVLEHWLRRWG